MSNLENETIRPNEDFLDFVGKQILLVDPRMQGFGLSPYAFLDAYANKFLMLTRREGVFVSPTKIPDTLLDYYADLGLDIAKSGNIIALEDSVNGNTLISRVANSPHAMSHLAQRQGYHIIPYMITPEVEEFAASNGFELQADSDEIRRLGNKARFHEVLSTFSEDIKKQMGMDVLIPSAITHVGQPVSYEQSIEEAYKNISENGEVDVVVMRPESASALGMFVIRSQHGIRGLQSTIARQFQTGEEVMISPFITHDESPSMQGTSNSHTNEYDHFYFGRQHIKFKEGKERDTVEYESSQMPFSSQTARISKTGLGHMREIHEMVGSRLAYKGLVGLDSVIRTDQNGDLQYLGYSEMNVHLPGSIAVYAAVTKLFPNGFNGIAHNGRVTLPPGQTLEDFMRENHELLVTAPNSYGVFPINGSYSDKVDVVLLAPDSEHLEQIINNLKV